MKPILSIIYVYFNTPKEILHSIRTLQNTSEEKNYEIIIVDNKSLKPLPVQMYALKHAKVIKNKENEGYGKAINKAAKESKGRYLLIVNPDVYFKEESVKRMIEQMERDKKVGIVGPKTSDNRGKILPTKSIRPTFLTGLVVYSDLKRVWPFKKRENEYHLSTLQTLSEVDVVGGACMMVRKTAFRRIGGFDERFFLYFEEADFCMRVKKAGYKIVFYPKAHVVHLGGRSLQQKDAIKKHFEKSRFLFFQKYFGTTLALVGELFFRMINKTSLFLLGILSLSLFLNLYKIGELMMFFGDYGRDYLVARDILLTGTIPLVGIPSSVVWLHQGPLSIYFIALSFLIGNFHPVAPAVLYALIGVASTYVVYILGKQFFNSQVGIIASLFYATSPNIIVNARLPYHTAPIPFFTCIFALFLLKVVNGEKKFIPMLFFTVGLLLQLELSNGVLFFLLASIFLLRRPIIKKKDVVNASFGFCLGILPFILHDTTHGFVQTVGFPLWVINRTRLFFGLTSSGNSTTFYIGDALSTIWQQISRVIFPASDIIVLGIMLTVIFFLFTRREVLFRKRNTQFLIVFLWLFIPIISYSIHAQPGTAYFPVLFPAIALIIGYSFYLASRVSKIFIPLCFLFILVNPFYLLYNEYFMVTKSFIGKVIPGSFNLGHSFSLRYDMVSFIVKDAKGKGIQIKAGGFLSRFSTGVDNYKYLVWYLGGKIEKNARLTYTIFEDKKDIPRNALLVYQNKYIYVVKNE